MEKGKGRTQKATKAKQASKKVPKKAVEVQRRSLDGKIQAYPNLLKGRPFNIKFI